MYALDVSNVVDENVVLEIGICLERIELLFVEIGFNGLFTRELRSAIMNRVDYWINPWSQSAPSPFRSRRSCCIGRSSANFVFLTNCDGDIVCTDDKGGVSWLQTRPPEKFLNRRDRGNRTQKKNAKSCLWKKTGNKISPNGPADNNANIPQCTE